jgi:exodeoxyribonuclease VII large subunit
LDQSRERLCLALLHGADRKKDRLELLIRRRGALLTQQRLQQEQQRLDRCRDALEDGTERFLQKRRDLLTTLGVRLEASDPLGALDRGFALVYDEQGNLLRGAKGSAVGQGIALQFRDGRVLAKVTGKDMYETE